MPYVKKRRIYRKGRVPLKRKRVYRKKTSVTSVVKKILNRQVEKKHDDINLASTDYTMGQVAGNANAFFSADVTPYMTTGANPNQRIGNEIMVTSFNMNYQIRQMSAATAPAKIKFYLFRLKGTNTETSSSLVGNLFNYNQFIGGGNQIYDLNSSMNTDYMGNYTLLRTWTSYLKPDQFSGQQMPVTRRIGAKFRKPLKVNWFSSTTGAYSQGRMILVAFSDCGNASTSSASTLSNLPVTAVNTGQFLNFSIRWYFTDM
jgi:hypothetical protein